MTDSGLNRRRFVQAAGATGLAAALPSTAGATPAQAALADDVDADGGAQELVVVFDTNEHVDQLDRFDLVEGYHRFEVLPIGYTIATGEQAQEIAALQSVVHVQPNRELEFHNAEARDVTGVDDVQRAGAGFTGENTHVAVIDSGLSNLHPDHRGTVKHNYKYRNPLQRETMWEDVKPADTDDNGHGSHVSGTVAGNGTYSTSAGTVTGEDQRGMAPDATLTVYSTGLTLAVLNTVAAFDDILARHTAETAASPDEVIHLTNNSYGPVSGNGDDFSPLSAMNVATYRCYDAGILSFFSAGNSGPATNTYSEYAKAPWIVGVAATNDEKAVANFSSRGRTPEYDEGGEGAHYDRQEALANVEALFAQAFGDFDSDDPDADSEGPHGVYRPDLGATGVSVVSTMSPDDPLQGLDNDDTNSLASPYYAAISGTSMSSPTATGATALVVDAYVEEFGEHPDPETVFELLEGPGTEFDGTETFDEEGHEIYNIGKGFIDVRFANDIGAAVERLTDDEQGEGEGLSIARTTAADQSDGF